MATLARVTRGFATHDITRGVVRQAVYVPAGVKVAWDWFKENCTGAGYARDVREVRAKGDFATLMELRKLQADDRHQRFERIKFYVRAPQEALKALMFLLVGALVVLLLCGGAAALIFHDSSLITGPVRAVMWCVATVVWLCTIGGVFIVGGLGALVVLCLWWAGKRAGDIPQFLAPAGERDGATREVIPDERAILAALRDLNLAPMNKKFKEGWLPRWPLATGRDGNGYRTQLELPPGVTVDMINQRKAVLAHNLVRLPVEVWPTEPQKQPGVLDLWVADQGLLSGPIPAYPLLKEGTCDYFKGVPVGFDQRGDVVMARMMASNYAIGGTMGCGKSSLVLNLVSGAALDPLVDIDVYVMAQNVDYDPFKDRLSTLVKGDEDEQITAAMDGLRELREEVTLRGKILAEMGGEETKVTRALARKDARLRPRLVVYDECQELFRHEKYGDQAKQLAIKVMTKARKCAITLVWVTPEPSADSLPRELPRVVSHGVCFAINDYIGNDAILGTGSYKRGISAVDLDPHENIGTAMAFGFGPRPGLLRCCYIRKDATADDLTPIARRSLDPWRGARPADPDEERDVLQDVHEAFGSKDLVKATDMATLLRDMAPGYLPYRWLNGEKVVELLGREGVEVRKLNGILTVRAELVLAELDRRQGVE